MLTWKAQRTIYIIHSVQWAKSADAEVIQIRCSANTASCKCTNSARNSADMKMDEQTSCNHGDEKRRCPHVKTTLCKWKQGKCVTADWLECLCWLPHVLWDPCLKRENGKQQSNCAPQWNVTFTFNTWPWRSDGQRKSELVNLCPMFYNKSYTKC